MSYIPKGGGNPVTPGADYSDRAALLAAGKQAFREDPALSIDVALAAHKLYGKQKEMAILRNAARAANAVTKKQTNSA